MGEELRDKVAALLVTSSAGQYMAGAGEPPAAPGDLRELLAELQPYDLAALLGELDEGHQFELLALLDSDVVAETLEHLDHDHQYRLLDHVDEAQARAILAEMSSDALVDLVGAIHPRQAKALLGLVPTADLTQIRQLMAYPENSAGGRMTIDYVAMRQNWTVEQASAHFRKVGRDAEVTNYFYVVDRAGRLVGVTSMREVFVSPPPTRLSDIMFTKVIAVEARADQEEAARLLSQYDFIALPVVDADGRLVGVITADDIIDVFEEETTEDIHLLGGTQPLEEPYLETGLPAMFRKRIGWLLVLFVAQSLTGNILRYYENFLDQVVALTFFIPMLIGTGGNSGGQASTLVIRAIAVGEIRFPDVLKVVWREARLGVALGAAMALVTYARALLLGGPVDLGLTVAVSIALMVVVGSTVGAALPLVGSRLGVDPAVFAAPMMTTVADAAGLLIYFQVARLIMGLG